MAVLSPQTVYENLTLLDDDNALSSATYREQAFEVLADPSVSLSWRQAIADRLNRANRLLALLTVGSEDDSY